jgi:hypothetical protein
MRGASTLFWGRRNTKELTNTSDFRSFAQSIKSNFPLFNKTYINKPNCYFVSVGLLKWVIWRQNQNSTAWRLLVEWHRKHTTLCYRRSKNQSLQLKCFDVFIYSWESACMILGWVNTAAFTVGSLDTFTRFVSVPFRVSLNFPKLITDGNIHDNSFFFKIYFLV